jgi:hypothetical protein
VLHASLANSDDALHQVKRAQLFETMSVPFAMTTCILVSECQLITLYARHEAACFTQEAKS